MATARLYPLSETEANTFKARARAGRPALRVATLQEAPDPLEGAVRKLKPLLERLDRCFVERERTARMTLLSMLAGQHVLLLGPPGTAKSQLARAVCRCVAGGSYFEYLLTKFTHPDELFGPVSIPGLKLEDYRRITDGYLPRAHIAFLDEVFKANSAVLNSLLSLLHERVFHHGSHRDEAPLLALIGASNEPPAADAGLDALFDRFLVRLTVSAVEDDTGFLEVCLGDLEAFDPSGDEQLTVLEIEALREAADRIPADGSTKQALVGLRRRLKERGIEASDRRWRQAVDLARMSAVTSGRDRVSTVDLLLLEACFGDPLEEQAVVRDALREAVEEAGPEDAEAGGLAHRWMALAAPMEAEDPAGAVAEGLRRLEQFEARVAELEAEVDGQREEVLETATGCPWLCEAPPHLVTGAIETRRRLALWGYAARTWRERLETHDLLAEVVSRLEDPTRLPMPGVGAAPAGQLEPPIWLRLPGEDPRWWALGDDGMPMEAARCIDRVRTRIWDRFDRATRLMADYGCLDWTRYVRVIELSAPLIFELLNLPDPTGRIETLLAQADESVAGATCKWTRLPIPELGVPEASRAENALKAFVEVLRMSGVRPVPPLPEVER